MTLEKHSSWLPSSPEEGAMLLICLLLFLAAASTARSEQILDLLPRSIVSSSYVLLKDIVSAPQSMPSSWADRRVMNAPEPGKTTEFSITSIAYALQQYPDMNSVLLRGQMQMTIERKVQTLSLDAITKLIADYIDSSENFAELESLKISISENMETPQIFSVEQCKLTGFERLNETNEYSFTLSYPVDAETTNTMAVKATIRQLRKAWVAKTPLNRGHILQAGDLALQPIQNETETNYLNADDPFAGMELSRSLRQNEPVNKNYLLEVICASKGDIVNIRASRGLLDITLKAKALTPGRKGDRIVCINEQSKKRINVTMVAPKEARLDI